VLVDHRLPVRQGWRDSVQRVKGATHRCAIDLRPTVDARACPAPSAPPGPGRVERDLIRERTTAGLAAARARGRHGGRPSVMTANKLQVAKEMYASGQYTVATIASTLGVSRASIYRHVTGDAS
jgi:hypothetical protein